VYLVPMCKGSGLIILAHAFESFQMRGQEGTLCCSLIPIIQA